jgi:hypothetical protein
METITAQIVNRGFAGEPEHICLQSLESLKIFEFSQIKHLVENEAITSLSLNDNDMTSEPIQRILNTGHKVQISFNENDEVTLHF